MAVPLPPLRLSNQTANTSGVSASTGLDLIAPTTVISFGGDGSDSGTGLASSVINSLAQQTRQLTAKGTILGDLGITPSVLLPIAVAAILTIGVVVTRRG